MPEPRDSERSEPVIALRDALGQVRLTTASHPGLLLDAYLKQHETERKLKGESRRTLLGQACNALDRANQDDVYGRAFHRWYASLDPGRSLRTKRRTSSRLLVGVGGGGVLETGLTLQHTYGTPMIPGSAVKGLCAHYCHAMWGPANSTFSGGDAPGREPGPFYLTAFGTTKSRGMLTFEDAWLLPEDLQGALVTDVVTPHNRNYYGTTAPEAPTGATDPVPIPLLSVKAGVRFCFAVVSEEGSDNGVQLLRLASQLLARALQEWGIGAKSRSGYGRMGS